MLKKYIQLSLHQNLPHDKLYFYLFTHYLKIRYHLIVFLLINIYFVIR
jgi:hypothetical protein